ncbi:MAG: metal-dependent hydrolase [Thermodesulfovibrionales bacterium]
MTHALSGLVLQQCGLRKRFSILIIFLSTLAPDLDYLTRIWGADLLLRYHRGITHGILVLFLFPLFMAFLFRKKTGFAYAYGLSLLGYGLHILMDLTNQYGTRVLSPLDWNQYSLDLTFIIDPYITGGLLLAVAMRWINPRRAQVFALCAVLLLSGYLAGKSYLQDRAKEFLKTKVDAQVYRLYPLPNDFLRWWFITKLNNEVSTGFADLFTQRVCIQEKYSLDRHDSLIQASEKTRVIRNFLSFARYPYAEVKKEGERTVVTWKDLAYSFLPGERVTAKVVMDGQGEVISSKFRF